MISKMKAEKDAAGGWAFLAAELSKNQDNPLTQKNWCISIYYVHKYGYMLHMTYLILYFQQSYELMFLYPPHGWIKWGSESRDRLPTPVFWPREFHGLYSLWGHKESNTTEKLSLSESLSKLSPKYGLFKSFFLLWAKFVSP